MGECSKESSATKNSTRACFLFLMDRIMRVHLEMAVDMDMAPTGMSMVRLTLESGNVTNSTGRVSDVSFSLV